MRGCQAEPSTYINTCLVVVAPVVVCALETQNGGDRFQLQHAVVDRRACLPGSWKKRESPRHQPVGGRLYIPTGAPAHADTSSERRGHINNVVPSCRAVVI